MLRRESKRGHLQVGGGGGGTIKLGQALSKSDEIQREAFERRASWLRESLKQPNIDEGRKREGNRRGRLRGPLPLLKDVSEKQRRELYANKRPRSDGSRCRSFARRTFVCRTCRFPLSLQEQDRKQLRLFTWALVVISKFTPNRSDYYQLQRKTMKERSKTEVNLFTLVQQPFKNPAGQYDASTRASETANVYIDVCIYTLGWSLLDDVSNSLALTP